MHVHDFDFGAQAPEVRLLDVTDPLGEFYESDDDDDDEDGAPARDDVAATATTQRKEEGVGVGVKGKVMGAPEIPPRAPVMGAGTPAGLGIGAAAAAAAGGGGGGFSYFHLNPHGILSSGATATPFSPSHWGAPPAPTQPPPASSQYKSPTSPTPSKSRDRNLDLQTTLHIVYDGDMSLGLTAEVMLDYPMPSFVGIPLELRICGIKFDGVGVVAYLRGRQQMPEEGDGDGGTEKSRGKVKFCFLGEEEARVLLAGEVEGEGEGGPEKRGEMEGTGGGGLLKEIRIESEIGRKGEGKQVLKNVGKVERFVLEQVRRIFEEEFVWPSFWTVLV